MNTPTQDPQTQAAPRAPQIDPQLLTLLQELDGFLSRALLTRQETVRSTDVIQTLVRYLEGQKLTIDQLTARLQPPQAVVDGAFADKKS